MFAGGTVGHFLEPYVLKILFIVIIIFFASSKNMNAAYLLVFIKGAGLNWV